MQIKPKLTTLPNLCRVKSNSVVAHNVAAVARQSKM